MSPLDDTELAAQLKRRSGDPRAVASLADQVRERSVGERQSPLRAWDRWQWPSTPARRASAWRTAATVASGALVLVLASTLTALGPASPPVASVARSWLLTNEQLIEVAHAASSNPSNVGRAVVAEVRLARAEVDCAQPPCPAIYSLLGSLTVAGPRVRVDGLPDAPTCPPPGDCTMANPTTGRMAVIIGRGRVTFLGWVRLGPDAGAWSPGAVGPLLADPTPLQGRLFVVDGWLTGYGGAISCPAGFPPPTTRPAREEGYRCGDAAWITPERYVSTTVTSAGFEVHPPADGVRVQNGAYEAFASSPAVPAEPRHGLYLIDPIGPVEDCFDCPSIGVGRLVVRIDPIEIPLEPATTFPTVVPLETTSPDGTAPGWMLSQADLVAAVRQATLGVGVGRVVVADVPFELAGNCGGTADPSSCYPIVKGSDPPIRVLGVKSSRLCPPTWRCAFELQPAVPADGPFALRITGDGTIEWVGWAGTTLDGHPAWAFPELRTQLARFSADQLDAYKLQVVPAWISGAFSIPRCLSLTGEDARFDCGSGEPAWLTAQAAQPNGLSPNGWQLIAPSPAIRIQNGAYAAFAPDPTTPSPSTVPEPRFGTFLVLPVLPAPTRCVFCDHPAVVAEVVARLDPP